MKGKTALESELKYGLDASGYARLARRFAGRARRIRQTNVYFDEPKGLALRRAGCGARIRFAPGKAPVLTLKCPTAQRKSGPRAWKVREEHEAKLAEKVARAVAHGRKPLGEITAAPIARLRERVAPETVARVVPLGRMQTLRLAAPWRDGLVIELDKFTLFDETFYELEIETTEPHETDRAVRELFRELGVPYRPVAISKLGRFLRAWRRRRRAAPTHRPRRR